MCSESCSEELGKRGQGRTWLSDRQHLAYYPDGDLPSVKILANHPLLLCAGKTRPFCGIKEAGRRQSSRQRRKNELRQCAVSSGLPFFGTETLSNQSETRQSQHICFFDLTSLLCQQGVEGSSLEETCHDEAAGPAT